MTIQVNPSDALIERNRVGRVASTILSPFLAVLICQALGEWLFAFMGLPMWPGGLLGLAAGSGLAVFLIGRSFIVNEAVQAFVTVNPIASLMGAEDALVSYGPGTHLCFWWEQRLAGNNVALNAAAQSFTTKVQASNGTLTTAESYRLRPDLQRLPEFLSGVASVPNELTGLIQAEINAWMAGKPVEVVLNTIGALNTHLNDVFVDKDHPIEQRYGIIIDDVTVNEVLPSAELQETMGALFESKTIDQIVATSFGYASARSLQTAVNKGKIASEEVNRRRTQTMAMSGNLQGMNLNSTDFNLNIGGLKELKDIPPELIQAFGTAAKAIAVVTEARGRRTAAPKPPANKGAAK